MSFNETLNAVYRQAGKLAVAAAEEARSLKQEMSHNIHTRLYIGLILAISSSVFIGMSFIIKKKGLQSSKASGEISAGDGGYGYLLNFEWWTGIIMMIFGETANFAAYSFAPAVIVTPMGGFSVVISAILADHMLGEALSATGRLGCGLCLAGSTVIVLHAPKERIVSTVQDIVDNMISPGFLVYLGIVAVSCIILIGRIAPKHGKRHILVYLSICSLFGSLSVMAIKALGLAIRLTISGHNQFNKPMTWLFVIGVVICIAVQMNYLNKSLDLFNTAHVTAVYYVFFTTSVIIASVILFQDWKGQPVVNIVSQISGLTVCFVGVYILQMSRTPPANSNIEKNVDNEVMDENKSVSCRSRPTSKKHESSLII